MIDIGGEVIVNGKNPKMNAWRIGINKPIDDSLSVNQELQTILEISNVGMATSGNYRNFYYKGGKKYSHTIDPRTGYRYNTVFFLPPLLPVIAPQPTPMPLHLW